MPVAWPEAARLDAASALLSGVCIVHCLALPLAVALFPLLGDAGGHAVHEWLLFAVVPVSIAALAAGLRRHGDRRVLALGVAGLALLCVAAFGHRFAGLPEAPERALSLIGGLVHACAHLLNARPRGRCADGAARASAAPCCTATFKNRCRGR